MGCIVSKGAASASPASHANNSGEIRIKRSENSQYNVSGSRKISHPPRVKKSSENRKEKQPPERVGKENGGGEKLHTSRSRSSASNFSLSLRFGTFKNQVGAEQRAAGWPGWLAGVAGEAIHGWLPLRSDSFEKLEKIGQGTYSSVFRARENATGRIVALKKVRFDNFHPESVRFMAREITILRRLDHPNIMKLHGLITSQLSSSIYLVFDYMEHDLSGLISCPNIKFTGSQIKCFMQQLLYGLDYCHSRGVMHRDIKTSNILLHNGVLKLADFGLANFISTRYRQPLTSRVVTLWYRPPELLLGSTNYGAYVDLWSVGCVFAELLIGKPILKGKTEVEQLHKIFKLCGSPLEEFWKKSKLPHATMFKPQAPYESSLRERCKGFPEPAVNLLETLLSIEPENRGTAANALRSEYFTTMPYACDPESLPKYPPSKEIDTKSREEARRKKTGRVQDSSSSRVPRRVHKGLPEPSSVSMLGRPEEPQISRKHAQRNGRIALVSQLKKGGDNERVPIDMRSDVSHVTNASQGDIIFGGLPLQSCSFAGTQRKTKDVAFAGASIRASIRSHNSSVYPSILVNANNTRPEESDDIEAAWTKDLASFSQKQAQLHEDRRE